MAWHIQRAVRNLMWVEESNKFTRSCISLIKFDFILFQDTTMIRKRVALDASSAFLITLLFYYLHFVMYLLVINNTMPNVTAFGVHKGS